MTTLVSTADQPVVKPAPTVSRRRWIFPLILFVLYLTVTTPFVFTHSIWRDEAQAFLLARDSATPWDLVINARYEGHPLLWHMLLWILTRAVTNPFAMQLLHLSLAATSVALFARFAPVPALTKILFTFSYYALFEYSIVARNYQIMLLLAIIFCILWQRRREAFLWQSLTLGLLANTNVFGALMSFGLFALLFCEMCLTRRGWHAWRRHYMMCLAAIFLFFILAGAAVLTMKPPADYSYSPEWYWDLHPHHITQTLFCAFRGLIPVPSDRPNFWNSSFFPFSAGATAGLYLLIIIAVLLLFSPRALWVYIVAGAGILAFLHVKYPGSLRHQGSLFVTFLCCSWIALAPRDKPPGYFGQLFRGVLQLALIVLLCVHIWAVCIALKHCWKTPFSSGDAAYACLKAKMTDEPLVAEDDMKSASITAHLPGRQLFYLRGDRWGTFILFKQAPRTQSVFRAAHTIADERQKPVIVILFGKDRRIPRDAELLGSFGGSISGDDYTLYRIQPKAPATTTAAK